MNSASESLAGASPSGGPPRKKVSGVYQIRCRRSGKIYIGSSADIAVRWRHHRWSLNRGVSTCTMLQYAWRKHGESEFEFSILDECHVDLLEEREQFFIDKLKPEYNSITDVKRRFGAEMIANRAAAVRAHAASITHCPQGHAYDEANTYINKNGSRICRACNRARVNAVFAGQTPEQREARLAKNRLSHQKNVADRRAQQHEYREGRKEEKREYDKLYRARTADRRKQRRANETPRAARSSLSAEARLLPSDKEAQVRSGDQSHPSQRRVAGCAAFSALMKMS